MYTIQEWPQSHRKTDIQLPLVAEHIEKYFHHVVKNIIDLCTHATQPMHEYPNCKVGCQFGLVLELFHQALPQAAKGSSRAAHPTQDGFQISVLQLSHKLDTVDMPANVTMVIHSVRYTYYEHNDITPNIN